MTPFDTIVSVILVLSLIYSVLKGMIRELFSLAAYTGGYLMAIKYKGGVADLLIKAVGNKTGANVLSFILIFFVCKIIIGLIGSTIRNIVHSAPTLSLADRAVGGLIGTLKGLVIVVALMYPLKYFPDINREITRNSIFAPHLKTVSNFVNRNMVGTSLFDQLPNLSMDDVTDKFQDIKKLGGNLKEILPAEDDKPQDIYTKEDQSKLDNIFKTLDKD